MLWEAKVRGGPHPHGIQSRAVTSFVVTKGKVQCTCSEQPEQELALHMAEYIFTTFRAGNCPFSATKGTMQCTISAIVGTCLYSGNKEYGAVHSLSNAPLYGLEERGPACAGVKFGARLIHWVPAACTIEGACPLLLHRCQEASAGHSEQGMEARQRNSLPVWQGPSSLGASI